VEVVPGILATSNRDHLAICVRGVGVSPGEEAEVTAAVRAALPKLAENPAWWKAAAGLPPPTVDNDCPAKPAIYDPDAWVAGQEPRSLSDPLLFGRIVSLPDAHRVVVYVIPEDELVRIGADRLPFSHEEVVCRGDQCIEVTSGVYVAPGAASAGEMIRLDIATVLGFERAAP
jgi:hypothetical protein